MRLPILVLLLVYCSIVRAGGPFEPFEPTYITQDVARSGENERLVSSGLAVLLGPFGAHRIYLGTTPKVAILYGVTFGGFGVLVLLDLGHLLFTKDLAPYRNNDRIMMWGKPKEMVTPQ